MTGFIRLHTITGGVTLLPVADIAAVVNATPKKGSPKTAGAGMSMEPVEIPITRFRWLPKDCPLWMLTATGQGKWRVTLGGDWQAERGEPCKVSVFPSDAPSSVHPHHLSLRLVSPADVRYYVPLILQRHFALRGEPTALWDDVNECYALIWPDELWRRSSTAAPPECPGDTVEECFLTAMRAVFP